MEMEEITYRLALCRLKLLERGLMPRINKRAFLELADELYNEYGLTFEDAFRKYGDLFEPRLRYNVLLNGS